MSNSKYIRLKEIFPQKFNIDAPVELDKAALLLEATSNTVILQVRLNLLKPSKELSSITISIDSFSDSGEAIEGYSPFNYTFQDVYLVDQDSLGDRTPIILDSKIRNVKIEISKVVFTNGEIWQGEGKKISLPNQSSVRYSNTELNAQYKREFEKLSAKTQRSFRFFPIQEDDYWVCSCGRPNRNTVEICERCALSRKVAFELTNEDYLQEKLKAYKAEVEEKAVQLEKELEIKKAEKIRKEKKQLRFIIVFITLLSLILIYTLTVKPARYKSGMNSLKNKEFDSAILTFTDLGNYRDSSEKVVEVSYEKAVFLLEQKNFVEARSLFNDLGAYSNSEEMVKEVDFQTGINYFENGDFSSSKRIFEKLGDYSDSIEKLNEVNYQLGMSYFKNGDYSSAKNIFLTLDDYSDSAEKIIEIYEIDYQVAVGYLDNGHFDKALSAFEKLGDYLDSKEKLNQILDYLFRAIDGMEQIDVPAGEFIMGSEARNTDEKPVRNVYLDAYRIDKYEVTNGQYKKCVRDGACTRPQGSGSYARPSYYGNSAFDNYPVIYVDWHQAKAYCEWAGGDLPTEAQWEKAARGTDGREYPWGNQPPDSSYANYGWNEDDTTKVGSYEKGTSPFGAMDMAGNVWEWVNDDYGGYNANDTNNPTGNNSGPVKATRGGSLNLDDTYVRAASRNYGVPTYSYYGLGFRCASPVEKNGVGSTENMPSEDKNNSQNITEDPINTSILDLGSTQIRKIDGMEQVDVPAGEFIMGSEAERNDEKPVRIVYLDAYRIDKYEVTNSQYRKCVEAGKCTKPHESESKTRSSYYGSPRYDNYPVIYVDWNQAKAYCAWAGGDLPTEAQWEKAARGTDGRKYPWGNDEPDGSYSNYNDYIGDTTEVGRYEKGASPYGSMDMAGNVEEWVNDWYAEEYDANDTNNPKGPSSTRHFRVLRGGDFHDEISTIRMAYRGYHFPEELGGLPYAGFRCVSLP